MVSRFNRVGVRGGVELCLLCFRRGMFGEVYDSYFLYDVWGKGERKFVKFLYVMVEI